MILPAEMAEIYWSRLKGMSVYEVEEKIRHNPTPAGKKYWQDVLTILFARKLRRS